MYRLPPLKTLRIFEAAGRHLSFKQAAEELGLTPSAISHGIQTLEDWLGITLFDRGNRGLTLTEAGAAYLPHVRDALEMLATATEAVHGRRADGRLTVSVPPTFGLRWLVPHLPRFREKYPQIEVSVDSSHRQVEFPRDGIDLAIRMGRGDWTNLYSKPLVREELVPVCTPALAERIRTLADLEAQTLLHVLNASEDWKAWCTLSEVELKNIDAGGRFDTIHMAIEAAAEGMGVAIGRLPLVSADIKSGRIVPVLGPPRASATQYWLVAGRKSVERPEVVKFSRWISSEFGWGSTPVEQLF